MEGALVQKKEEWNVGVRVYHFFSFVDKDGIFLDKVDVEGQEGCQCHIRSHT